VQLNDSSNTAKQLLPCRGSERSLYRLIASLERDRAGR
jgi:hypothetical protein